jgi:hypothetical protein
MKKTNKTNNRSNLNIPFEDMGGGDQAPKSGINWKRLDDAIYAYELDLNIEFDIDDEDSRQLAAEKAVATACVRSENVMPSTVLWLQKYGAGCAGTEMAIPVSSAVMLSLAGYYWENRDRLSQAGEDVDWQSPDLARGIEIIAEARGRLHVGMERIELEALVSNDLAGWLEFVKGALSSHHDFIQRVARLLVSKGRLSGAQFDYLDLNEPRRINKAETGDVKGDGQVSAS